MAVDTLAKWYKDTGDTAIIYLFFQLFLSVAERVVAANYVMVILIDW